MESPQIYLIGGPARVGKSTLAKKLRSQVDGQVMSGDAYIKSIREVFSPEVAPDLHVDTINKPIVGITPHDQFVERLRLRDKTAWELTLGYINAVQEISKDNIIIDSNFWPDYLCSLSDREHRAVFLIDTSPQREEVLKQIRDSNSDENNWMKERKYTDEKIKLWAEFDIYRSQQIKKLCIEHNYTYFDLANNSMSEVQELAIDYLLTTK